MALYVAMLSSLQLGGKGKRSRMRSLNRKKGSLSLFPCKVQTQQGLVWFGTKLGWASRSS